MKFLKKITASLLLFIFSLLAQVGRLILVSIGCFLGLFAFCFGAIFYIVTAFYWGGWFHIARLSARHNVVVDKGEQE